MRDSETPRLDLAEILIRALDDPALALLAERLGPHLSIESPSKGPAQIQSDGWMNSRSAAAYLGLSLNSLHKLTASRTIPFEQSGPGCKCWFRRSDLDRWRGGRNADQDPHLRPRRRLP